VQLTIATFKVYCKVFATYTLQQLIQLLRWLEKNMTTLHFIMDPQCGWCYAAAPLVDALIAVPALQISVHAGGLFSGVNKGPLTAQFRHHIKASDKKITALTGQPFSDRYYDALFANPKRILDSDTPIAAVLAAGSLGIAPVAMLHQMQTAQFVDGHCMADIDNLNRIATALGADSKSFVHALAFFHGEKTNLHISQSRHLLGVVGGHGFPCFAIEHANGSYSKLDHSSFYGKPRLWSAYVMQIAQQLR
jgi:putative protein-disulfide isomerase